MAAMRSDKFCSERLPGGKTVGDFDMSKVSIFDIDHNPYP
jgi:hypothetical protein